jgi:hypothetical protein
MVSSTLCPTLELQQMLVHRTNVIVLHHGLVSSSWAKPLPPLLQQNQLPRHLALCLLVLLLVLLAGLMACQHFVLGALIFGSPSVHSSSSSSSSRSTVGQSDTKGIPTRA